MNRVMGILGLKKWTRGMGGAGVLSLAILLAWAGSISMLSAETNDVTKGYLLSIKQLMEVEVSTVSRVDERTAMAALRSSSNISDNRDSGHRRHPGRSDTRGVGQVARWSSVPERAARHSRHCPVRSRPDP
jgi:hypothetical protein